MVKAEELDRGVDGLGRELGIAETACCRGGGPVSAEGTGTFHDGERKEIPGIMYVNDLRADSICETWLAFLVMKSSYIASHFGGRARASRTLARGGDHLVFVCAASAGVDILKTMGVKALRATVVEREGQRESATRAALRREVVVRGMRG